MLLAALSVAPACRVAVSQELPQEIPKETRLRVKKGLQLWVEAEDLWDRGDGASIDRWPDFSGQNNDLTSVSGRRPRLRFGADHDPYVVAFRGSGKWTAGTDYLHIPLAGRWQEITLLIAGRKLDCFGLFDSAPMAPGSLRLRGPVEHTGTKCVIQQPFPGLEFEGRFFGVEPRMHVIAVRVRRTPEGAEVVESFVDGRRRGESRDDKPAHQILLKDARIGDINRGAAGEFDGELAEILIYDRALTDGELAAVTDYLTAKYWAGEKWIAAGERTLPNSQSWLGNSFSGKEKWMQLGISAMAVASDGTVYTNTIWDEAGREVGFYKDGDVVGSAGHTHGWGYMGGQAVAVSDDFLFISQVVGSERGKLQDPHTWPPKGRHWIGVSRRMRDGKAAPFSGGRGGAGDTLRDSYLLIAEVPVREGWRGILGLAATDELLYVSDAYHSKIRCNDTMTMRPVLTWDLERPGRIAIGDAGRVWVAQDGSVGGALPKVLCFSRDGKKLPQEIACLGTPKALAVDGRGRLLLAEDTEDCQARIFSDLETKPRQIGSFGVKGGILAGRRGEMGDRKLLPISELGLDGNGNLVIASNARGVVDLRCFSQEGSLLWRLYCNQFVDCGDFDPATDGDDVYTAEEHFVYVPRGKPGREWNWQGYTVDHMRFPDDPRLHPLPAHSIATARVVRMDGHLLMYVWGQIPTALSIYRKEENSEIFIPCGMLLGYGTSQKRFDWPKQSPDRHPWLWCDANGDGQMGADEFETSPAPQAEKHAWGWHVDDRGGVWYCLERTGIRHLPLKEIDRDGVPVYSLSDQVSIEMPEPFTRLMRIECFPDSDTAYLSGYTKDRPKQEGPWGMVGSELVRYDLWSKRQRRIRWRAPLHHSNWHRDNFKSMSVCPSAGRAFLAHTATHVIYVYDTETGERVGVLKPDRELFGRVGWIDMVNGIRAFRRKSGEVLLLVEEVWKQKQIVYRLAPAPVQE